MNKLKIKMKINKKMKIFFKDMKILKLLKS